MRFFVLLIFFSIVQTCLAQNEFAAAAFYKDFQKIYADGQKGFIQYKGVKKKSVLPELTDEFKVKILLPLADSGKLVFPKNGKPYAEYYFQPSKSKESIDLRASMLREAIATAYNKPLFTRSETIRSDNTPFSNTWFYTEPEPANTAAAIFRTSIVRSGKYYIMSFRLIGELPSQTPSRIQNSN
jgi:hypothetical protein